MSHIFLVQYTDEANFDQITKLQRALDNIGPGPVEAEPAANAFVATLNWGVSGRDLANLKGKLNSTVPIVVSVAVDDARAVAIDTFYWSRAFTDLVRQSARTYWGNWNLNQQVAAGAVGYIDPQSGSFTKVADLPNADIQQLVAPAAWSIESSSVRQTQSSVEFKGGYFDPSSGTEVTAGLDVAWSFAKEGSIASNATVSGQSALNDFGTVLQNNFNWLLDKARSVGYATPDGGIRQGFGVVTHVRHCRGVMNLGSKNANSSFSVVGSVDGVSAMIGTGKISGSVKGSYKEVNKTSAFESWLWPAEPNEAAAGEVALCYQFASFQGKQLIPTWLQLLDNFRVIFDNSHGGTYIGNCTIEYITTDDNTVRRLETKVPGGQVKTLDNIPLNALDVEITVHFTAGDTYHFMVDAPLTRLLNGSMTIDLSGVWPWGSKAEIRDNQGQL